MNDDEDQPTNFFEMVDVNDIYDWINLKQWNKTLILYLLLNITHFVFYKSFLFVNPLQSESGK